MDQIISGLGTPDMGGFDSNYSGKPRASKLINYFCSVSTTLSILYFESLDFVAVGLTEEPYYLRVCVRQIDTASHNEAFVFFPYFQTV